MRVEPNTLVNVMFCFEAGNKRYLQHAPLLVSYVYENTAYFVLGHVKHPAVARLKCDILGVPFEDIRTIRGQPGVAIH